VTLTMTLAAPWGAHVSADVRLIDPRTGKPVENRDGKLIPYTTHVGRFSSVTAYCGLALMRSFATARWLARVIGTQEPESLLAMGELIRDEANRVMSRMSPHLDPLARWLSFTTAAVDTDGVAVMVVSNRDHIDGRIEEEPRPEFHLEFLRPRRSVLVITGLREAVPRSDRKLLRHAFARGSDHEAIRNLMARVNASASNGLGGRQWISRGCLVDTLFLSGETHLVAFDLDEALMPPMFLGGVDLQAMASEVIKKTFPQGGKLVQMASGYSAEPRSSYTIDFPPTGKGARVDSPDGSPSPPSASEEERAPEGTEPGSGTDDDDGTRSGQ
jgi:hypothetical protein